MRVITPRREKINRFGNCSNAAAHKKQYESLPSKKKAIVIETKDEQRHEHLTEEKKKISAQIWSVAATLYDKVDLINQILNFYVNILTRIQHWHWHIIIVVQQIHVLQYSMTS